MPIIQPSPYQPPVYLKNGHLQTIYASYFRKQEDIHYTRERIDTPDGDFLDLDWSKTGSGQLVIISHGLEGNSTRPYVMGMVQALNRAGRDVLAWNFRSCSGEPNRLPKFYHSGAIDDLETVIRHAIEKHQYQHIDLVGFSMGGNITLMFLGSQGKDIYPAIQRAAVFSVPVDLADSARQLAKWSSLLYMKRFLKKLEQKLTAKQHLYPDIIDLTNFNQIKNFKQYDNRYTAPLHGFKDAEDYWARCSSGKFLDTIAIPTLLVNALNDPFLGKKCYPRSAASQSKYLFLEIPSTGGHVGFPQFNGDDQYWSEQRAVEFLNSEK